MYGFKPISSLVLYIHRLVHLKCEFNVYRNFVSFTAFLFAVSTITACQTVTRTERLQTSSLRAGYTAIKGRVQWTRTKTWGVTVYIKRAEDNGKLELCGFAVLAGNKNTQPASLVNLAQSVLQEQIIFIGSREVSHTGFMKMFGEYKGAIANCILTEALFENALLYQKLEVSRGNLDKGHPRW